MRASRQAFRIPVEIARFKPIEEPLVLCRTRRGQKYGTNHALAAGGYSTHHPEALGAAPTAE
ncbi:hypothetical protein PspLS_09657 [Pyricularia sp. CBS 133598]|nr:hypothetical protein PspLS_09657 [Pyricularia sp. CBS 133598]